MTTPAPGRARAAAIRRLIAAHRDEWEILYREEKEALGVRPNNQGPYKPIRHGTNAGYTAHLRQGEPMCEACREARRSESQGWRDARGRSA